MPETGKYSEESINEQNGQTLISNSIKSAKKELVKSNLPADSDFDAVEDQLNLLIE